jgi:UDP-3-O-[3-hydroxymyristoyl] glucosamine N-acyltransferase
MNKKNSFTLQELAEFTQCKLVGDPNQIVCNVSDLENATPNDVSFFSNARYLQDLKKCQAGAIFIGPEHALLDGKNFLISEQPSLAFQKVVDQLFPQRKYPSGFTGIHPSAVIHQTAQIAEDVSIGPCAIIDENVKIGRRSFISAGVYIGPDCLIGEDCLLYPNVTLRENCQLGNRVIIQPGAVIGSCGFGYITDKQGRHQKLNQVGNVLIEDDVEIGANATIDRSRFKSTIIGSGSKLDNLVQIGHGVTLGTGNIIVAQTGIAGSTSTGKYVVLAGQVAVAGHLHLDDGVTVAGKSGVSKSLKSGKYGGIPAVDIGEYNRNQVFLRNIETYVKQLKALDKRLSEIEKTSS